MMGSYKFTMFANTLRGNKDIHNVGTGKRNDVPEGGVSGLATFIGSCNTGNLTCVTLRRSKAIGSSFTGFVASRRVSTLMGTVSKRPKSLLLFTTSGGGIM